MELTILGSAAAEGWPALFCTCEACREARRLGGKDLRHRTSYRLGDHIQIDWGPDTFAASIALGLNTSTITDLVVTHTHEDHLAPQEFYYRRPGFSQVSEDSVLTIHGSEQVEEALCGKIDDDSPFRLAFDQLKAYEERELGAELAQQEVSLIPVPAAHAQDIGGAYNYIFRIDSRRLLLGNDTGWWEDEVWDCLAGFTFDVVIMDSTYGPHRERRGHLGVHEVVEARQELASRGALKENCRLVANHFSHNGGWLHAQLEEFFAPHDIEVGYDGMVLEV